MLLLFEESWWAGINAVYGVLLILIAAAIGVIILLSTRRRETDTINEKRAVASDALVKVRDIRIIDLEKEVKDHKEELEETTSELRTITGIKMDELFKFWATKSDKEAHWANIEDENVALKKRLQDIHKTDA